MGRLTLIERKIYQTAGTRFSILDPAQQARVFDRLPPDRRTKLEHLIGLYRVELRQAGKRALSISSSSGDGGGVSYLFSLIKGGKKQ